MMTENFLILMSDTKPEIQKAHKRAKRINTKNNNNKKKTNKQTKNYTLAYHIQTLENQKKKMHWKKQSKKKKKKRNKLYFMVKLRFLIQNEKFEFTKGYTIYWKQLIKERTLLIKIKN